MREKLKHAPAGKGASPARRQPQRRPRQNQQGQPAARPRRAESRQEPQKTGNALAVSADAAAASAMQSAAGRRLSLIHI